MGGGSPRLSTSLDLTILGGICSRLTNRCLAKKRASKKQENIILQPPRIGDPNAALGRY